MNAKSRSAQLEKEVANSQPISIHELWARNAQARYFCYIGNDFVQAEFHLAAALARLEVGFPQGIFPGEANVLLPILLLNFARVARLAGDIKKAQDRLIQLKTLLENRESAQSSKSEILSAFPQEVVGRTNWIKSWMGEKLVPSGRVYMADKMETLARKMGAS